MPASFIAVALVAAVLLVNWRLVLLVIAASLLALMAFGLGVVHAEPAFGAPAAGVPTTSQVHQGEVPGEEVGRPRGYG